MTSKIVLEIRMPAYGTGNPIEKQQVCTVQVIVEASLHDEDDLKTRLELLMSREVGSE